MAGKAGHNVNYLIQAQDEGDAESGIQVSKYNIEKLGSPSYGAAVWKGAHVHNLAARMRSPDLR